MTRPSLEPDVNAAARRRGLVLAALGLSLAMGAIVPLVTGALPPMAGYVAVLAIYWVGFCIPAALSFGGGPRRAAIGAGSPCPRLPWIARGPPLVVLVAAGPERWLGSDPRLLGIAVLCAAINGPLEELAWRRTFRANSDGRWWFELAGLGLFTGWHIPLFFARGVTFDHGAVGLVGGAFVLGAIWMAMTRANDSVGWPMISHALVNVAAFLPFFAMNFAG